MTTIRISEKLAQEAKKYAVLSHRSLPKQIEFWSQLGKIVEDNPDIPLNLLQDIQRAMQDVECGDVTPYTFDA